MSWKFVEFSKSYNRKNFNCRELELNDYLKTKISKDIERKANQSVLAINNKNEVIGFYTLSAGSIKFEKFPEHYKKKIAPYPISVALIGRLAVDVNYQGLGLGKELLMHAVDRVEEVGKKIGIRGIVVDAKNKSAEEFYLKYGFSHLASAQQLYPRKLFMII